MKILIFTMAILLSGGVPVKELYQLKKYDEIISKVDEKSSTEDLSYKSYSYFNLNNYAEASKTAESIVLANKSDSLKFLIASCAFYTKDDAKFNLYSSQITSKVYLDKLADLGSNQSDKNVIKSKEFLNRNNQGFCFDPVTSELIFAFENKIYKGSEVIYSSPGKYVSYPFVKGDKIFFSGNLFDGGNLSQKQLDQISRDRVSKLQLYVGKYSNGKVTEVEILRINNIEYDFIAPYVDENNYLYFSSNVPGGFGGYDIYRSELRDGEYSNAFNLGSQFNSPGNEVGYCEFKNKVYFSSDKEGLGKLDVYSCLRNSKLYGNFSNVGSGVNSRTSEFGMQINGAKGYYAQANEKGEISIRIIDVLNPRTESRFDFVNELKVSDPVFVNTVKTDYGNGIEYSDSINNTSADLFVDKQYSSNYVFQAYGYEPKKLNETQVIELNESVTGLKPKFYGAIEDFITGEPLSGVAVYAIKGNDTIVNYTDSAGNWFHAIEPNDGWTVLFGKSGYKMKEYSGEQLNPNGLRTISMGIDSKKGSKLEIRNIYFDYGKASVTSESIEVLDRIVEYMSMNPEIRFELSAHTDSRGSDPANLKLSDLRATTVYNYLVEKGIDNKRMLPKGYGESKPVNNCGNGSKCTEIEYQLNRRVEIKIL